MKFMLVILVAFIATGCAVTPPEPPEPVGELMPINKPFLSAVEVNETKPEPVNKHRKTKKRRHHHAK